MGWGEFCVWLLPQASKYPAVKAAPEQEPGSARICLPRRATFHDKVSPNNWSTLNSRATPFANEGTFPKPDLAHVRSRPVGLRPEETVLTLGPKVCAEGEKSR